MGLTPFRIQAQPGATAVEIDGQDVSALVSRVSVDAVTGEIPKVFLEVGGAGDITGEGIVHVTSPGIDPASVAEWLDGIDPGVLEAEMLASGDYSEPASVAALRVLKGWLRGD